MPIPLKYAMFAYDADSSKAKVFRHPDHNRRSWGYAMTTCACNFGWDKMSDERRRLQMLLEAWHAVVRDGLSVRAAHDALMQVPEYASMLAEDVIPTLEAQDRREK